MKKQTNLLIWILILYSEVLFGQWVKMDSLATATYTFGSSGNHLFAGTNTNGLYYSLDSGMTWTSSNLGITSLNVRSITAKDSIIFIGCDGDVYKSTNFGLNWSSSHNGITNLDIFSILFRGDSILAGSYGGGVFVSTDIGQNFVPINNGLTDHYVKCLFINGSRLFAGIQYGGGGIFVSDDNGATWIQKVNGIPKNPFNPNKYDDILSFTKTSQSIFASTFYSGVLKSDDNGETWTQIPIDNRAIWTLAGFDESVFSGHNVMGVNKSNDNGVNWEPCTDGLLDWDVYGLYIYGQYIYAGTHWGYVFRRPLSEVILGTSYNLLQNPLNSYIFPNPVKNISILYIPWSSVNPLTVYIINMEGKMMMKTKDIRKNTLLISKSYFPSGTYIYLVQEGNSQIYYGKFIVE